MSDLVQLAMEQRCILSKQYEQITKKTYDVQNMMGAWMKSDTKRMGDDPAPVTKHTITYDLNGGTLDGKTGTVTLQIEEGTTITLPEPTREGYIFSYWEGSAYNAGDSYTVEGERAEKRGYADSFKSLLINILIF